MRITVLSFSEIASDPRVSRQIAAFRGAGHDVAAVGFGADGGKGPVRCFPKPAQGWGNRLDLVLRQAPSLVSGRLAGPGYWAKPLHRAMYRAALATRPDAIHANDWTTLPIAGRLARLLSCPFVYDSHEFATGELQERLAWRLVFQPYVKAIEGLHIHQAAKVVTVGAKIAELIQSTYSLKSLPVVVRNTPAYRSFPFRSAGDPIEFLFQGMYNPGRNLEMLIASLPHWRADRRLTLRGVGNPGYLESLRALARDLGVTSKVRFDAPAPPDRLVEAAHGADVGIHLAPVDTPQNAYSLPNKFFEYTMAGLALCVSTAEEMANLTRRHDIGVVTSARSPDEVADAVNGFDRARIDSCKRNALAAARELCWERERERLLDIYRDLPCPAERAARVRTASATGSR